MLYHTGDNVFNALLCSHTELVWLCCVSRKSTSPEQPPPPPQQQPQQPSSNVRYKRETLHDMTRPLKQWLYKNKNNPYPTKQQKVKLADESKMTLVQVRVHFLPALI